MFSKKKNESKIDYEQRELYENARARTKQKESISAFCGLPDRSGIPDRSQRRDRVPGRFQTSWL